MKRIFILIIVLIHLSGVILGQKSISGVITDGLYPLPFCNVILLNLDTTMVTGEVSTDDGTFSLSAPKGEYLLKVSFVGFEDHDQLIHLDSDLYLDSILLVPSGTELDNVMITAQKTLIQRKPDRLIYNLSNSIAGQGTDMSEAIALAPGVTIQNGVISMIGRGATRVMIDGRILQLQGDELINFLSTISSDDIKSIEVISNPPAQYDAAGNGGLINIIYKKGRNNSWKNTSTLSYTKNRNGFANLRNSFQYNYEKHQFSSSFNLTHGESWGTEFGATSFPSAQQDWRSEYDTTEDQLSGRVAYDYKVNEKYQIGLQYQGSHSSPNVNGSAVTQLAINTIEIDSSFVNDGVDSRERTTHVANIHLISKLDTFGTQVSIDLDYFSYRQNSHSIFDIKSLDQREQFIELNRSRSVFSDQKIQNFSFNIDATQYINQLQLKYGIKYNHNLSNSELINFDRLSGSDVLDTNLSNSFDYKEDIAAAYVSGAVKLSDTWRAELGGRFEHTSTRGFSRTIDQLDRRKFLRFFPTVYLAYNPNEDHQFSLSLGGRINRASFRDLNPFRIYLNNNSYSEGNPFIQPSYTYTINFNHVFKGKYTTTAYFNSQRNGFGTLFVPFAEGRVLATLRDNFYDAKYIGLGEIFSIDVNKKWSIQNQIYLMYHHTTLYNNYNAVAQNGLQYYLSSNHSFTLGKGWNTQVNTWFNSQAKSNIFQIDRLWNISLGIKKKLLDDKIQISLQANDLFNQSGLDDLRSIINGITNTYGQNYSTRNIRMTISYIFGNDKVNNKARAFKNEDVQRRS